MVPDKYSLAAVGRYLIDSFERRRPGLRAWTPQMDAALRIEAEDEILQMERQCQELGIDDRKYWHRVRGAVEDVILPRYKKLAQDEIALANRDYGIWRGGDLVERAGFALVAFILGIIAVETPYIPIYAKWFPALMLVAGPLFPDLAMWWFRQRYQQKLAALVAELAKASKTLETYRPLSELQESLGLQPELAEGPAVVEPEPESDADTTGASSKSRKLRS